MRIVLEYDKKSQNFHSLLNKTLHNILSHNTIIDLVFQNDRDFVSILLEIDLFSSIAFNLLLYVRICNINYMI